MRPLRAYDLQGDRDGREAAGAGERDRHIESPGGRRGHSSCKCSGEPVAVSAPGTQQAGPWPWLEVLSRPHLVPEPLETALGCRHRHATPGDRGLPTPVYPCAKPTPRPGSWATHGLFHRKLQKTAQGTCASHHPPLALGVIQISNSAPHWHHIPQGEGQRLLPSWSCAGYLVLRGPQNHCSRTLIIPTT